MKENSTRLKSHFYRHKVRTCSCLLIIHSQCALQLLRVLQSQDVGWSMGLLAEMFLSSSSLRTHGSAQFLTCLALLSGHLLTAAVLQLLVLVVMRGHLQQPSAVYLNNLEELGMQIYLVMCTAGQCNRQIKKAMYKPQPYINCNLLNIINNKAWCNEQSPIINLIAKGKC